jgi:hypothetical protein
MRASTKVGVGIVAVVFVTGMAGPLMGEPWHRLEVIALPYLVMACFVVRFVLLFFVKRREDRGGTD